MGWRLRIGVVVLIAILLVLQYRLWVGKGSLAEVRNLQQQIEQQQLELDQLRERNHRLRVEVEDLKDGLEAIEARARRELGMIKEGETFYQVVPPAEAKP
ncbi:MAG: cell division protein FtsB [bacterium]